MRFLTSRVSLVAATIKPAERKKTTRQEDRSATIEAAGRLSRMPSSNPLVTVSSTWSRRTSGVRCAASGISILYCHGG